MRIRGLVATLAGTAALVGLAAAPLGTAPPTVATPYPQSGMSDKGACYGISVGTARNSNGIKTGLTMNNGPVSIAVKGFPSSKAESDAGTMGACLLSPELGVTTAAVLPTVLQWLKWLGVGYLLWLASTPSPCAAPCCRAHRSIP